MIKQCTNMTCHYCAEIKLVVCVLTACFGMGSWLAINGIWVELPILVDQLPEGWNLPSYLAIIIQLANIGPITITIFNVLGKRPPPKAMIIMILVTSALAGLMLTFLWTKTSYIAGAEHSTALFVFMFFIALCDCSSSVVFLPFMNSFKPQYMTSYYIGKGFSGLLPSVGALVQGVGQLDCVNTNTSSLVNDTNNSLFMANNTNSNSTEHLIIAVYRSPAFPVHAFFLFIFALTVVSGVSFALLNYLPYCKTEHAKMDQDKLAKCDQPSNCPKSSRECNDGTMKLHTDGVANSSGELQESNRSSYTLQPSCVKPEKMSKAGYILFLLLIGWVNALTNGILPSIQTYACLPYSSEVYHLAVTLSNIANPIACFVAFFVSVKSVGVICCVTFIGSSFAMYILTLAAYSPHPPLVDSISGAAIVVTSFVIVFLCLSFIKVTIATLFRVEGGKALLWCGAVTQLGSALGAAAMFVTVNVFSVFIKKSPCT